MAAENNKPAGGKWCVVLVWLIAAVMLLPFVHTVWLAQNTGEASTAATITWPGACPSTRCAARSA